MVYAQWSNAYLNSDGRIALRYEISRIQIDLLAERLEVIGLDEGAQLVELLLAERGEGQLLGGLGRWTIGLGHVLGPIVVLLLDELLVPLSGQVFTGTDHRAHCGIVEHVLLLSRVERTGR